MSTCYTNPEVQFGKSQYHCRLRKMKFHAFSSVLMRRADSWSVSKHFKYVRPVHAHVYVFTHIWTYDGLHIIAYRIKSIHFCEVLTMFPDSVKISATISLVKFAHAFQIHPVFLAKTGNADDSVQTTEYAHAPGLLKSYSHLPPKPHQMAVPSSSAKQEGNYEKASRKTDTYVRTPFGLEWS